MAELLQIAGAILILAAYILTQAGRLDQQSYLYLVLNVLGSGILGVLALIGRQWGFLLLEGVWALVSLWSIARLMMGRRPAEVPQPAPDRL